MRYEDKLIEMAYALILEPAKVFEFDRLMSREIKPGEAAKGCRKLTPQPELQGVEGHYETAYALSLKTAPLPPSKVGRVTLEETLSWFIVDGHGRIIRLSDVAKQDLGAELGGQIEDVLTHADDRRSVASGLNALRSNQQPKTLVLSLIENSEDSPQKYILEWDKNSIDGAVGIAQKLTAIWDDEIGRLFAQSLSLTSAEQAIAKAVVSQTTLRQLAKVRGRSIGTVRNQLKRLLAKLGLNSQTGLLSLYAAFAKFHHGDIKGRREAYKRDGKRTLQVLKLSNDYTLAVDTWGDDPLKPVLYLHPLIGGTSLTEQAKTVFAKAGYRLIMPWRPNYGSTDDCGSGLEQLSVYSDYLVEVLGHYGVERCPVIAANGAAPFGAAFASHHPDRCSGLIISAGAIPLTVDAQLNLMSMQLKVAYYVAKHSESIFRLYLRSTMNAIEAGFEESYARHFFERSVRDQETATSPEFRRLVVNAFSYCYLNGHDGALQDFVLNRTDWVSNYGSIGPRTHLIYGDDDSQHPPALIKQFARQLGGASYEIAEGAGSLVIYQAPETFVQALDRI